MVAARFEGYEEIRTAGGIPCFSQGVYFRVGFTITSMETFPDDSPIAYDHSPDHRVRLDASLALPGKVQSSTHEVVIGHGAKFTCIGRITVSVARQAEQPRPLSYVSEPFKVLQEVLSKRLFPLLVSVV